MRFECYLRNDVNISLYRFISFTRLLACKLTQTQTYFCPVILLADNNSGFTTFFSEIREKKESIKKTQKERQR